MVPPSVDDTEKQRRFSGITNGMSQTAVIALLGEPDEKRRVRTDLDPREPLDLLDGTQMRSATDEARSEAIRWTYGVRQLGTFAFLGCVSFDAQGSVITAVSPVGGFGGDGGWSQHSFSPTKYPLAKSSPLSCEINEIALNEADRACCRSYRMKLNIRNNGHVDYSHRARAQNIQLLSTVQIYDKEQRLLTPV